MNSQIPGIAVQIPKRFDDAPKRAFDQRWNLWRSSTGTPSISAMIVVGTGNAKSWIKSIWLWPLTASRSSSASA